MNAITSFRSWKSDPIFLFYLELSFVPSSPRLRISEAPFHPTFLYEMLWNLLGVAILLLLDRRLRLRRGMMLWAYVAWYTAGRVWIERLRIDDAPGVQTYNGWRRYDEAPSWTFAQAPVPAAEGTVKVTHPSKGTTRLAWKSTAGADLAAEVIHAPLKITFLRSMHHSSIACLSN